MVKKIIIVLAVILAGLMLGTIFSILPSIKFNLPQLNTKVTPNGQSNQKSNLPQLQVVLSASPSAIKAEGDLDPFNKADNSKIEKSVLTIKYKNNSSSDLKNVVLHFFALSTTRYGIGATPNGNATHNSAKQAKDKSSLVFDTKDVKSGAENQAHVVFFGKNPGTAVVTVEVSSNGANAKSNPVTITVQ